MRKLIYSMGVSLDGFIAGRDGEIGWSAPGEELHRFHNEQMRAVGAHLCGRRLYETMVYWETAHEDPAASPTELEFARLWQALPKIVVSTTLESVVGNARLVRGDVAAEVARLKAEPGPDLAVGGAGRARPQGPRGQIDEKGRYVCPVVLGGGTPFFPALDAPIDLELVETRTFGSRVVYLRYRTQPSPL